MRSFVRNPDLRLYGPAVVLGLLAQLETWFGEEFTGDAVHAPLYLVSCAALVLRRRAPLICLALTTLPIVVFTAQGETDFAAAQLMAMVLAVVSLAMYTDNRAFAAGFALAFAVSVANGLAEKPNDIGDVIFPLLFLGLPAAAGRTARVWRTQAEQLARLARELEHEREERARLAVAEERGRIAREMHDVVAHSLGVIVVQAGGARLQLDADIEDSRRALEVIESTGRQSLSEIRGLLGRLRDDDEMVLAPQPGLGQLDQLVERGQSGRRLDLPVGGGVLAQHAHHLVDLGDGLAGDVLDRRERLARALGIVLGLQAPHPGVDEDHVDCVPGGVVQVAGDPPALLRDGEEALPLRIALGAQRPLLELGHPLAPQPRTVPGEPGAAPQDHAEHGVRALDTARCHVRGEQERHQRQREAHLGARAVAGGHEVQRDGGA